VLDPIAGDNVINDTEAGQDIPVTGFVQDDYKAGDIVTLTVNGKTFTGPVDADGKFSIMVPGSDLVADGLGANDDGSGTKDDHIVDASIECHDPEGFPYGDTTIGHYEVDRVKPQITVDAPDNTSDTTPTITGTTDVAPGSIVTIIVTDAKGNEQTLITTVKPGGTYSVDVETPLAEGDYKADASVSDLAGNTATDTDPGSVDTIPPVCLDIVLDADITPDDIINAVEKGHIIPIKGEVTGEYKMGDVVTLTVNGKPFTGPVTAEGKFSINVPGSDLAADPDKTIDASVTSTDAAGNSMTATDTEGYGVDIIAPVRLTIELDADITADDIINAADVGQNIPVSGTVAGEFKAGDIVTLTVNGKTFSGPVDAKGRFTIDVFGDDLKLDPDHIIDASVTSTDAAGNSMTATDTEGYGVDVTAPNAPTVIIVDDLNNDGTLTRAEIGADQVQVQALVNNSDLVEGGKVTLTINNGGVISSVDLTLNADGSLDSSDGKDYSYNSNGTISWTEPTPADSKSLTVTATQTDHAGNVSPEASDTATVIIPEGVKITLNAHTIMAFMDFEDADVTGGQTVSNGAMCNEEVDLNTIKGAGVIGEWQANATGKIEVGQEGVYHNYNNISNQVLEIEGLNGVNEIYTNLKLESGRFYELDFDVSARTDAKLSTCGMTVSMIKLDAFGNDIAGTTELLYDFSPKSTSWLRDQTVNLHVDESAEYKLVFKSKDSGDSTGAILDNINFKALDNTGYTHESIKLSSISTALVDADGSETLTVLLSGLPDGAQLFDGIHNVTFAAGEKVDITDWKLDSLQMTTDKSGSYTLTVDAITTETKTGESISNDANFTVTVLPGSSPAPTSVLVDEHADNGLHQDDSVLSAVSHDDGHAAMNTADKSALAPSAADEQTADHTSDAAMNTVHAGLGDHILCGTEDEDLFVWGQQEKPAGTVTKDIVNDFNHNQGDKLDLSALLDNNGTQSHDDMKDLLSVFEKDDGVHLEVKDADTHSVTQEIVLADHSFNSLTGGMGSTATQVVDYMLNNHMLELDK
ncbi:MAG: Ig-like domain-containing protein, partial [Aeromonas sp.]